MFPIFLNIPQPAIYPQQFYFIYKSPQVIEPCYSIFQNQPSINNVEEINKIQRKSNTYVDESSSEYGSFNRKTYSSTKYRRIKKREIDLKRNRQNPLRNIISNICHHLMGYMKKCTSTKKIVERIVQIHNFDMSSQQFFIILNETKFSNYVRKITLEKLWSDNQNPEFTKIFRILSYYFLNNKCFSSVLYSRKIKKDLKLQHLPKIRELLELLSKQIVE